MQTTKMLKKNYEFKQILEKGKSYAGIYIKAYIKPNGKTINLLGLAIGAKIGKAYQRNKIKRLIRENYKNTEKSIKKGYSIIFLVKKNMDIKEIDFKKINKDITNIFKNAEIMEK